MVILTSCFVTFTVAILFVSMLGGIYGHGRKRIFLGGFAIGAWGYLILVYGTYNLNYLGTRLLATRAVQFFGNSFLDDPPSYACDFFPNVYYNPIDEARSQIHAIGSCGFSFASGLLCALTAIQFSRGASRTEHPAKLQFDKSSDVEIPRSKMLESSRAREYVNALSEVGE